MGQTQTTTQPLYTKVSEEGGRTIVKAGGRLFQLRINCHPDTATSLQHQEQLKSAKLLSNEHLLSLCHFQAQTDQNFCSSFYRVFLFFEYLPHTLATEIAARRDQRNRFSDKELWSILCSCTLAFSYLQQQGIEVECFNLKDILLSDDGVIKLNSPFNTASTCSSTIFDPSYLYSPEQLDGETYSKPISGVYQLGLAILACIDLRLEEEIYTRDGYVDLLKVNNRLRESSMIVEKRMSSMLNCMLQQNPSSRPDWITLEKMILQSIQPPAPQPPLSPEVKDVPVYMVTEAKLGPPSLPLGVDSPDEPSLLCFQTEADEECRDQNNNDMMETDRFQEETVLRVSRKQECASNFTDRDTVKVKRNQSVPEVVNQEFEGGRYQGQKLDGYRQGYGTFHYSQGGIYTGQWNLNKMEGEGCLYYPSGKLAYEGNWHDDKLQGYGTLYNQEVAKLKQSFEYRSFDNIGDYWVKYEGHFKNDNKEGKGKLVLSNGQWFSGIFSDDKVHGEGEFYRKDGIKVSGRWHKNQMTR